MAITLRSLREIDLLREAGAVVAEALLKLQEYAKDGVTTGELDRIASGIAADAGAECLFRGVQSSYAKFPFPGAICASVNHEVVHGIPSDQVVLRNGDIVGVDFGVRLNGYCGDSAVTIPIGEISDKNRKLLDATKGMLDIAIANCAVSVKWSHVAGLMQKSAEAKGFSVVKDLVGHGIGTEMWEEPQVPNYVSKGLLRNDIVLAEGMILAIEPMVNVGSDAVVTLENGWDVVTMDRCCSAHFEHTIAIMKSGCEVLTKI